MAGEGSPRTLWVKCPRVERPHVPKEVDWVWSIVCMASSIDWPHSVGFLVREHLSRRVGVVASVLATGPNGRGCKPDRGDGFWREINICSTPSFGWEAKPEVPCRKILRNVKDPVTRQRY
jgi:hypothetical protein